MRSASSISSGVVGLELRTCCFCGVPARELRRLPALRWEACDPGRVEARDALVRRDACEPGRALCLVPGRLPRREACRLVARCGEMGLMFVRE